MFEKKPFIENIRVLLIETTNLCNYHCSFCPREKMTRPLGTMSFEIFKKIIDEAQNYNIKEINLNSFGEPLLDPLLVKRIEYIRSKPALKDVIICFNTNGSPLNKKLAIGLIMAGLDEMRVSIYATNPKNYRELTKYGNFYKVKNNLIMLAELKKKLRKEKPEINLGFLQVPGVNENFKEWSQSWQKHINNILGSSFKLHNFPGGREYVKINKNIKRMTCGRVHQIANVLQNGDVSICCVDFNGTTIFGNVKNQSLKEILESKSYQNAVKVHRGNFRNCPIPLCDNCNLLLPATLRNKVGRWIFLHIKRRYIGR